MAYSDCDNYQNRVLLTGIVSDKLQRIQLKALELKRAGVELGAEIEQLAIESRLTLDEVSHD